MSDRDKQMQISITVRQLQELVGPVLPCAGVDEMLPVLTAVDVWTDGKWIFAATTDRFRAALKRVAAAEGASFPEFHALIPTRVLESITKLFQGQRGSDPMLTLTVHKDQLTVEAGGGLVDLGSAKATYWLMTADNFPDVVSLIAKAIAAQGDDLGSQSGFNFEYLASFKSATVRRHEPLQLKLTSTASGKAGPALILGEDFAGILMPRVFIGDVADAAYDGSDWLPSIERRSAAIKASHKDRNAAAQKKLQKAGVA
ncbi:hypothetical protein Back2_17610 [Nocardioides baekrokdamisoli]|uniref:DNA polymerase III beta sliding clamp central domain-containing protein n=1 Tax=Nocardioides baekrokdamisoli TaxID=1804624 RepID=A0A3G9J1Z5_9ACTN|nr:hypothetical protein [Nocardioides baekrokdamisoli]BBH17474.1 hypothetical protein Back2_17610 [Nocardioides baekrokdamisoli]